MTTIQRLLAALAGAAVLALGTPLAIGGLAAPASAHASLVGTDPEAGSSIATLPDTVTLTFSQDMRAPAYVVVTGPDGDVVEGDPTIDGAEVTQAVGAAPAGDYTLTYRVVSDDGHPVSGSVPFEVTEGSGEASGAGGTGTGSAPATEADPAEADAGTPRTDAAATRPDEGWWSRHSDHVLVFGGLVLVAGALLAVALRGARE